MTGSETVGAKLHGRDGISRLPPNKVPKSMLSVKGSTLP